MSRPQGRRSSPGACHILVALLLCTRLCATAAEPFLRPNDVIALIGGEDVVAASEYGYLELLLTRALPEHRLKFRCLAWEGDTVFEQPRMLNYPTLEQQLDQVGATVVIAQFGQMEALGGVGVPAAGDGVSPARTSDARGDRSGRMPEPAGETPALPGNSPRAPDPAVADFLAAYERLIERVSAAGKRRVALIAPNDFRPKKALPIFMGLPVAIIDEPSPENETFAAYIAAIEGLAKRKSVLWIDTRSEAGRGRNREFFATRDGIHLTQEAAGFVAQAIGQQLAPGGAEAVRGRLETLLDLPEDHPRWLSSRRIAQLITAKNRLWHHYYRPQNWAFLAGDRTKQPSSRDHRDPTKRWFPEEMEQFLPLIEAKEREIWDLAKKLAEEK